jgi:hypothetical protein
MSEDRLLQIGREVGLEGELAEAILVERQRRDGSAGANARFYLAVLGALPWIGVMISAILSRWAESEQQGLNDLHRRWLEEHEERLRDVQHTVHQIEDRVAGFGAEGAHRLNSDEFLGLARKGFRVWDRSETKDKRELIRKLLTNAACSRLVSDDFVHRFIEWIDSYNELHFRVVRCVYKTPEITRAGIWREIRGIAVREDSADADLFKLLIRDLSTGGVIRQYRATDAHGNFQRKSRAPSGRGSTSMTKSAFDDDEPYVLTELGKDFVSYVLSDVVRRLPNASGEVEPPSTSSDRL